MQETSASIQITPLPAFSDNYLWLIHTGKHSLVVDPGDAEVVEQALQSGGYQLDGILLTHHHADHTGGAKALQEHWHCPVYAPASEHPAYQALKTIRVLDGDDIQFPTFPKLSCQVISLPGHTLDHIAYYINDQHLFSGDVLFGAGCGRLFEGTPAQMFASLQKLSALPSDTLIYPAHEYTAHNIAFALGIEPENQTLQIRAQNTAKLREKLEPTLPTTLSLEKATNPFLRCESLTQLPSFHNLQPVEIFAELRARRNVF
jgi:hydroxyacylglutathione hydrolase